MVGRTSILPKNGFFVFYEIEKKGASPFSWLLEHPLIVSLLHLIETLEGFLRKPVILRVEDRVIVANSI